MEMRKKMNMLKKQMKKQKYFSTSNIDMVNGPLPGNLLLFTLPIALSSILQQLFNAMDTTIAGHFCDKNALASVGANGEIIALIITLSSGLSIGVNLLISRQISRLRKMNSNRQETETIQAIQAIKISLQLALVIGIVGLLIGQSLVRPLLTLIQTPEQIFDSATLYLRIYLMGYPFLLLYDFASAILRAQGDSRSPFLALTLSGILNVLLNLLFVIVFHLGVAGIAIATDLSTLLSAILVLGIVIYKNQIRISIRTFPAFPGKLGQFQIGQFTRIENDAKETIKEILKTGIPSAIQGAVFCFANIFVQASVNRFGASAIAGSTIAMNFEYFAYYGITAFGQTATTFTCQNYSVGQNLRCRKILWFCLGFSTLCSLLMIVPVILFRIPLSKMFSPDSLVIEYAGIRIMCILFFEPICCFYEIPAGVLRGSGHAILPTISTMVGTCAFRIGWICTVFQTHPSLEVLYHAFPLSWICTILLIGLSFLIVNPLTRK